MACLPFNPAALQRVFISSFGHQTLLPLQKTTTEITALLDDLCRVSPGLELWRGTPCLGGDLSESASRYSIPRSAMALSKAIRLRSDCLRASRRRMESPASAHIQQHRGTWRPTMSANPARWAYRSVRESTR